MQFNCKLSCFLPAHACISTWPCCFVPNAQILCSLPPHTPAPPALSLSLPGGTAYLSLESQEEPYLGGIKYTAMPPTKRFRDMEQLSGGGGGVCLLLMPEACDRCVVHACRR
jgi:hypothetical protein